MREATKSIGAKSMLVEAPKALALVRKRSPSSNVLQPLRSILQAATEQFKAKTSQRKLRLAETISLGDKRFVSVVEVDGERLLIGGSATNIVLLKHLNPAAERVAEITPAPVFTDVLTRVAPKSIPAITADAWEGVE